jgi:hypothetical protein
MFLAQRTRDLIEREAAFDIFFRNEDRMLAGADRLHRLAKDSIAERAYWCAVGDLVRRYGSATELFRLAFRLSPMTAFVRPSTICWAWSAQCLASAELFVRL